MAYNIRPKFEETLNRFEFNRQFKVYFDGEAEKDKPHIIEELEGLPDREYIGETVDAKLKTVPGKEFDFSKLTQDYSLQQLIDMGVLNVSKSGLSEATKTPEKQIEKKYMKSKKGPGSKRLYVTPKPKITESKLRKMERQMRKIISESD